VGEAVPDGEGYGDGRGSHFESLKVEFKCVDLLGNVASFSELKGEARIDVPLDQIRTVWRKTKEGEKSWEVSIVGSLHHCDDEWQHWPPA